MVLTVLESTHHGPEVTQINLETIEKTSKMLKTCFFLGFISYEGRLNKTYMRGGVWNQMVAETNCVIRFRHGLHHKRGKMLEITNPPTKKKSSSQDLPFLAASAGSLGELISVEI